MDLIMMLQKMGAVIDVKTDRTIVIIGVDKLNGASHRVIPDRLEAASFASAAIASKGDVLIEDAQHKDMITFLNTIRLIGAEYEVQDNGIRFYYKGKLKPINIETDVHPGFMTDWQPPMTILYHRLMAFQLSMKQFMRTVLVTLRSLSRWVRTLTLQRTAWAGRAGFMVQIINIVQS
jgi:UDP-N-acetylglucosamine enolpyruvyl transferase